MKTSLLACLTRGAIAPLLLTSHLLLLMTSSLPLTSSCPSSGATEQLRTVVTGRCVQYKTLVNPGVLCGSANRTNCSAAAESFIDAFSGQDACNVSITRFDAFLAKTRHVIPRDMSIFWHGVYGFVHRYTKASGRRVTLEDTLTGYLIDGLRFCSTSTGIGDPTTAFCPTYAETEGCPWNAEASFWSAASRNFATKARGAITIMFNASITPAFSTTSYFGVWELPNLTTGVVTHAYIWLVHVPGDVIIETCESSSIRTLRNLLRAQNIPSTCRVNPRDVQWLLCWDHQDDPQCQKLLTSGVGTTVTMDTCLPLILFLVVLKQVLL